MLVSMKNYYQKIKKLNIEHYTGEIPYYSKAPFRKAEIVILSRIKKGSKILDLGCGSGRFSINAGKMGFNVTGIDIVPGAINTCIKRSIQEKLPEIKFLVADMSEIPFPDNSFDYVFCPRFSINAVATLKKRKEAIKEMIRVVKPGGMVFVESFNKLYLGKGHLFFLKNIFRDLARYFRIIFCKLINKEYKGLLPGDITYESNKVSTASKGYAHLPTFYEIKRLIPRGRKFKFYSIFQLVNNKKRDFLKFFRYSMWVFVEK